MTYPIRAIILLLSVLAAISTTRAAESMATPGPVPGQVQFAGRIEGLNLTAEGAEATEVKAGVRGITFSLFAEQSGGAALWVENQNVSVSGDGAYSTLLGAETQGGIPQSIFSDRGASGAARWLEVSYTGADGATITQPRVLLVSVPYALKAGDAASLGGLPVSAFVLNTDAVASRVSDTGGLPGATITDVLPSAAVTAGRIAKFNSALATDVVDSIITESAGKIGIGTTTPVGTIDVGGWASIPGDIQGVGSTISGDVFMGNTNGGIGRFRMASNALQGFFSWNQYYNGTNHKGMDATAPGWRVNIGGTGAEDAYYVERSPATAGGHVPARLFVVNGNGNVGINTGTAAPLSTLDVGGWPAIPNDIQGVGTTISGDVFMGNTNGGIGRYRMASNSAQGFFSWNQYYNGVGHKGMDATAPGWRINVGGTGIEDAFYVERSPATAGLHAPARLFQVSGSGNVGIGTIAPTAKFHVVGNTLTSGTATVGGFTMNVGSSLNGKVLTSDANGVGTWQTPAGGGGGGISGSGTVGKLAKFTGASTLGDSMLSENNGTLKVGEGLPDTSSSIIGGASVRDGRLEVLGGPIRAAQGLQLAAGSRISCYNCTSGATAAIAGNVTISGNTGTTAFVVDNSVQVEKSPDGEDGGPVFEGPVEWNASNPGNSSRANVAEAKNALSDAPPFQSITGGTPILTIKGLTGTEFVFDNNGNARLGYQGNIIATGVEGASMGGGKVGSINTITDSFSTVAGGSGNQAGDGSADVANSQFVTVGGGSSNVAYGVGSVIAGGISNKTFDNNNSVGGGSGNVAGRNDNPTNNPNISQDPLNARYATIPGGDNNEASGTVSFAAGRRAKARHDGAFVWADSTEADWVSSGNDQFLIRADGGVGIGINNPTERLQVEGNVKISGTGNGLKFPDGSTQTTAASGGGTATDVNCLNPCVSAGEIVDAAVTSAKLLDDTIVSADINDGTIVNADINATAGITPSKIAGTAAVLNTGNTFSGNQTINGDLTVNATGGGFRVVGHATSPNMVGGFSGNFFAVGKHGTTIGGGGTSGFLNRVGDSYGTVSGGVNNQAGDPSGFIPDSRFATVGGGSDNTANGQYATIPGGIMNTASGTYSFAAGRRAKALHSGSFVWADSTDADFSSTAINQFLVRASNFSLGIQGGTSVLSMNNARFAHSYGTLNTFLGAGAGNFITTGAGLNTGVGPNVLAANTTGFQNTAVGGLSLSSNTVGFNNTAVGFNALLLNTDGVSNTAVGESAAKNNTTGDYNTAVGGSALHWNTTGYENTATGYLALNQNISGFNNTANGYLALEANTTGYQNTAIGSNTLDSNSTGYSNTAIGMNSLQSNSTGFYNTGVGAWALYLNTTGDSNTALGVDALQFNVGGSSNTASGTSALFSNTAGNNNTADGVQALYLNTTGYSNTGIGVQALKSNNIGYNNTASGMQALLSNTSGGFNTANGVHTLSSNTTGNNNTSAGVDALVGNTTGSNNTAVGMNALFSNNTGNNNTAVGFAANVGSAGLTNATAIGANAIVDSSNKIRLGDANVSVIQGQVAFTASSDRNQKEGFRAVDERDVLKKVAEIPVTSWNYIGHDPAKYRHYGPMAQDFYAAFGHDSVGEVGSATTINSGDMTGVLMLAVQALEKQNAAQQTEISELREMLLILQRQMGTQVSKSVVSGQ